MRCGLMHLSVKKVRKYLVLWASTKTSSQQAHRLAESPPWPHTQLVSSSSKLLHLFFELSIEYPVLFSFSSEMTEASMLSALLGSIRQFCRQSAAAIFSSDFAWSILPLAIISPILGIVILDKTPRTTTTAVSSSKLNPSDSLARASKIFFCSRYVELIFFIFCLKNGTFVLLIAYHVPAAEQF